MNKKVFVIYMLLFLSMMLFMACVSTSEAAELNQNNIFDTQNIAISQLTTDSMQDDSSSKASTKKNKSSNADVHQEKESSLEKEYLEYIDSLTLTSITSPSATRKSRAFNAPFSIKVTQNNIPVADLRIKVLYPTNSKNSDPIFTETDITTNNDGIAQFTSPVPNFACDGSVIFQIFPEQITSAIETAIVEKQVSIPFKVRTDKTYGLSLALVDFNQSGNALSTNTSSTAMQPPMMKVGFTGIGNGIPGFNSNIIAGKTEALYKQAKEIFGNTVQYLVFGTVKYAEAPIRNENGTYTINLNSEVSVMSMKNGEVFFTTNVSVSATENSEWAALNSARTDKLANALTEKLLYGL